MAIYSYAYLHELVQTENAKKYIEECQEYYEKNFKDTPIYNLPFSAYRDFLSSGNRRMYETPFFARRRRLNILQVLALCDDKYLEELEEILAAICDEFTWVVPAHYYQGNKIDLFSATTARILAETVYVFGNKLSKLIQERVRESIYQKIVCEYEDKKNSFWWEVTNCNWAAVCACGVGLSYLFLFPERFEEIEIRLFDTFKSYLVGFDEEGYCEEGVDYWQYGFTYFCAFFDAYEKMKGVRPDFIDTEKVKKVIKYAHNARMSKDIYLPFEDGGSATFNICAECACIIKLLYPNDFEIEEMQTALPPEHSGFFLQTLRGVALFNETIPIFCEEESVYYKKAQVFIRKREQYTFTVQCGNNGVSHNHNDVGAFQIVKNNQRVICDFGAGLYTKEYFGTNEQRYKIFACNSLSHSVPIVDGKLQMYGMEYHGEVLLQDENSIVMDISKAYDNGPESLIIEYHTEKDFVLVKYYCKGVKEKIVFHFVSDLEPIAEQKGIRLGSAYISSNIGVQAKITHREEASKKHSRNVYLIDYEVLEKEEITAEFVVWLGEEKC